MDDQQQEALRDRIEALYPAIWRHALWKAKQVFGSGARSVDGDVELPGGSSVMSILHDLIMKMLTGKNAYPDDVELKVCLKRNISRDLCHLAKKLGRSRLLFEDPEDLNDLLDQGVEAGLSSGIPDPRQAAILGEQQVADEEFMIGVYCSIEDDPGLRKILDRLLEGCKPQAIGAELKMPVKEVQNAQKRLRRRLKSYLDGVASN